MHLLEIVRDKALMQPSPMPLDGVGFEELCPVVSLIEREPGPS